MLTLITITLAYLMGSVCSAIIVCKLFQLPDPRLEGSKNPGATNILRIAGGKYAAMVLLIDLLKGTIPVLISRYLGAEPLLLGCVGLAAVIGHIDPLFFSFKGGKGVATALGVLLGFNPELGCLVILTWLMVAFISRFSSLASIISLTSAPIYVIFFPNLSAGFLPLLIITILVLYQHRDNFSRLFKKTESKIDFKFKKGK